MVGKLKVVKEGGEAINILLPSTILLGCAKLLRGGKRKKGEKGAQGCLMDAY